MRALVTGATGFVGAGLARRLLASGHEVHLLVRTARPSWRIEEIRAAVRLHVVDVQDRAACTALLRDVRPDWIFNLMAHGAYSSQTDPDEMVRTNLLGTMHLLQAGLDVGFRAFVQAGSSSEYGLKDHSPSEDEVVRPNSHYAITKAAATHLCQLTAAQHDAHIVTLRLYSVFGPYEEPTRLIPTLIVNGLRGRLPPLVDPKTARDFIYTEDVNDACLAVAAAEGLPRGTVFNVGTGTQVTLEAAVAVVRRLLQVAVEPRWGTMAGRSWDTTTWVSDPSRLHRSVGWTSRYTFDAGIAATVEWLRGNEEAFAHYDRNIP